MCLAHAASGVATGAHWHTVDQPIEATFALLSRSGSGLRLWDIRDPQQPIEAAYFNGGASGAPPYYDKARGLIYLAAGGNLWVLELEPQVREALDLGPAPFGYFHPEGKAPGAGPSVENPLGPSYIGLRSIEATRRVQFCWLG